ncbi:MAG: hypothetical protein BWK80_34720 [Desulfobacteraceae bacterium IS3]|nr:MAG: hypothetical protein BWK80_34720 [Desulfobacteraceae bacterium IS3]
MKKILTDSSSAIILFKTELFHQLTKTYRILMAKSVYGELTAEGYPGAKTFREYCKNKQFFVFSSDNEASCRQIPLSGKGERDTVCRFLEGIGDFIMIDDGKGVGYCRDNSIPHINALLFPRILYLAGNISEAEYRDKTDAVIHVGRYSEKVIAYSAACSQNEIGFFMP